MPKEGNGLYTFVENSDVNCFNDSPRGLKLSYLPSVADNAPSEWDSRSRCTGSGLSTAGFYITLKRGDRFIFFMHKNPGPRVLCMLDKQEIDLNETCCTTPRPRRGMAVLISPSVFFLVSPSVLRAVFI